MPCARKQQQPNAHRSLTVTRPKIDDRLLDAEEWRSRAEELVGLVIDGTVKINIVGSAYRSAMLPKPTLCWRPWPRAENPPAPR